jgi:phage terminase Nu1 subunit (DNA packaging protein)
MIDEEIYLLTRHGRFESSFIETIPVYRRRYFLHLLEKEAEKLEEEADKANQGSQSQPYGNIPQGPK